MDDSNVLTVKEGSSYFWMDKRIFFWLGDTAWLMFHKLKREEIDTYLMNRAQKGFNVIQTVAVHHFPAVNAYGLAAFEGDDWRRPLDQVQAPEPLQDRVSEQLQDQVSDQLQAQVPDQLQDRVPEQLQDQVPEQVQNQSPDSYWALIDWTIERAGALGLFVALLPHWGNLSDHTDVEDMKVYIEFLCNRYGNKPNVIWMTGGDIRGDIRPDYWKIMGSLLHSRCLKQRISFHPFGRTSSADYFPDEPWMDFHLFQSGHRRYDQQQLDRWDDTSTRGPYYGEDNWKYVRDARKLKRLLPVLDAEPSYEHIPQGLHIEGEPCWTPQQVRRYGWWSVLNGAAGFTYGHNSVMQFYNGSGAGAFFVRYPWQDALHGPGCGSVSIMGNLMREIFDELTDSAMTVLRKRMHGHDADEDTDVLDGLAQYVQRVCGPCESMLFGESAWKCEEREERIMAFRAGDYILCYTYTGRAICLNLDSGSQWQSWWLDPESGVRSYAGNVEVIAENAVRTFVPPLGDFGHQDWLLILKKGQKLPDGDKVFLKEA